jgi:hypothetical protein
MGGHLAPVRHLASIFLWGDFYHRKSYGMIFLKFIEATEEVKVFSCSEGGQILLLRGLRRGESKLPSQQLILGVGVGGSLHHPQHHHWLYLEDQLHPLIVCERPKP